MSSDAAGAGPAGDRATEGENPMMPTRLRRSRILSWLLLAAFLSPLSATALDQPISGKKLQLRRSSNGKEKLVFQSMDPAFPFPALGSADDPSIGTPGGLTVELFSQSDPSHPVLDAPVGVGKPGWQVVTGSNPSFKYRNSVAPAGPSPLKVIVLKRGKQMKVTGAAIGLGLATAQNSIAIRITTGSLRSCTVFGPSTIRRDQAGSFLATKALAPSIPDCSDASLGVPGTTTSTTAAPATTTSIPGSTTTTTSTTLPAGSELLDIVTVLGSGNCGTVRDGSASLLKSIACGGLDLGGGGSTVPEGLIPDGATSRLLISSCAGSVCDVAPVAASGGGIDCTDVGCNFGPPLPIPNASLSTCVVNTFAQAISGTIDKSTGAASVNVPLSSHVFLTSNAPQPCPRCSATGSPVSQGFGTCDRGARMGLACSTTNSQGLSSDCLPGGSDGSSDLSVIGVNLSPLLTSTASASDPNGLFCPGQTTTNSNEGCFGQPTCRSISVDGLPAGALTPGVAQPIELAATFCVPGTANGIINAAASLPGPGAASLPATVMLTEVVGSTTTTSSTTSLPPTTTTGASTTTTPTTSTSTTSTLLPPLLPLTVEFASVAGTGACGVTRDGLGGTLGTLDCGELSLGNGNGGLPPSTLPDGAVVHFRLGGCSVLPLATCALDAEPTPGVGFDCTSTGCSFGAPVPIPNGALSVCSVNTFAAPASGTVNLLDGSTTANVSLNLQIFLTSNPGQPCPRCSATGTPAAPGSGSCDRGARAGLTCTSTNSQGLSRDCLPGGSDGSTGLGTIGANLSPVTTGTASKSNPTGLFCPGQTAPGCFGEATCRSITETGTSPGAAITSALAPQPATLVSTFCVAATGNNLLDGPAGLAGPAAISLPGQVRSQL
jgi:hypothetical protein